MVVFSKILKILNKNTLRVIPLDGMITDFVNKSEVKCPKYGKVER